MSFDGVRDLYQEVILDRSRHPRHMRALGPYDAAARGDNPMCGDQVEVRVAFGPDGRLAEAGFEGRGCAISLAAADLMAEVVRGRDPAEIRALFAAFRDLVRTGGSAAADPALTMLRPLAGVHEYPSRVKCATLPWHALLAALDGAKEASSE
jgi:nitrogen fixation NifU-like protein